MSEVFIKWLEAHFPVLTIITILVGTAIFITWSIAKKYFYWTARIAGSEAQCGKIDSHILPQLTAIEKTTDSINTIISNLAVYLKTKDEKFDTSILKANSPTRLTPLGEEILERTGGKHFVDDYLEELFSSIDDKGVKTALDVQNAGPIIIYTYSDKEGFNHIKDFLFECPKYKVTSAEGGEAFLDLDISMIASIMGIYLRDKYLQKHPELYPAA